MKIYNDINKLTRECFISNLPKAILLEGPPGTGKTSTARILSNQVGVPLVYKSYSKIETYHNRKHSIEVVWRF